MKVFFRGRGVLAARLDDIHVATNTDRVSRTLWFIFSSQLTFYNHAA